MKMRINKQEITTIKFYEKEIKNYYQKEELKSQKYKIHLSIQWIQCLILYVQIGNKR